MKLRDIRISNLEALIEEAGTARRLADRSETDPAYLSQIRTAVKTPNGKARGVGDKLANKLEKAMGKPDGWMDQDHDADAGRKTANSLLVASSPTKARLLALAHTLASSEQVTDETAAQAIGYLEALLGKTKVADPNIKALRAEFEKQQKR